MSYETPDRIWVEQELKLMDEMGRKWFIQNPPKIWKLPKKPDDLILESMKRTLRDELRYQFKTYASFAHRYLKDLVSDKRRIIIHHWDVSEAERKIQKILGYRFFKYDRNNWRADVKRIIGEIREDESESVVR